jgi:hypothetical protein
MISSEHSPPAAASASCGADRSLSANISHPIYLRGLNERSNGQSYVISDMTHKKMLHIFFSKRITPLSLFLPWMW